MADVATYGAATANGDVFTGSSVELANLPQRLWTPHLPGKRWVYDSTTLASGVDVVAQSSLPNLVLPLPTLFARSELIVLDAYFEYLNNSVEGTIGLEFGVEGVHDRAGPGFLLATSASTTGRFTHRFRPYWRPAGANLSVDLSCTEDWLLVPAGELTVSIRARAYLR